MNFDDYVSQDMLGLAGLIKSRAVSAREVLDAALKRLDEVNPRINCIATDLRERAKLDAKNVPSGSFEGVPYLLKDHGALMKGVPTSLGSPVFNKRVQEADSAIVSSMREAGLVIFGKTTLPELSAGYETASPMFGITHNPWDLERSASGSSGGSVAAVAAGVVPGAHASDGSGSIRVPASWTGLFGFKPSRGRNSYAPVREGGFGNVVQHAVTRSVRDSAALLDATCGPRPGDPYALSRPETSFLEETRRDPGQLKIGFSTGGYLTDHILPEIRAAVLEAAHLCETLGHTVEETVLPKGYPADEARVLVSAAISSSLRAEAERTGIELDDRVLSTMGLWLLERGSQITAHQYLQALAGMQPYLIAVAEHHAKYDAILTATSGVLPPKIGEYHSFLPDDPAGFTDFNNRIQPNTPPDNLGGHAGMSVPLAWSKSGLPIGIHFSSKMGRDDVLFRLAGQLESARPWFNRRPEL